MRRSEKAQSFYLYTLGWFRCRLSFSCENVSKTANRVGLRIQGTRWTHQQSGNLGDCAAQHEQRRHGRRENPNYLAVQPGDVVALNNGRTAACSASILTATPTITGPCLLGNVRVKAEIDRRVDAYSRAAAIESAGKDDRGIDLTRYRKQFNGTTSYVAVAADWLARTGASVAIS